MRLDRNLKPSADVYGVWGLGNSASTCLFPGKRIDSRYVVASDVAVHRDDLCVISLGIIPTTAFGRTMTGPYKTGMLTSVIDAHNVAHLTRITHEVTKNSLDAIGRKHRIPADSIAYIQSAFAFPMRVVAQVLGISPTQLYKWLDAKSKVDLHESSQRRLDSIYQLASRWLRYSELPIGKDRKLPAFGGRTIVDLLSADQLDTDAINEAFVKLGSHKSRNVSRSQRLLARGITPRRHPLPDDD